MRSKPTLFLTMLLLATVAASGQGRHAKKKAQDPPTDTVAPDIPGVVAGGTRVQVIKDGFQGTEGPISLSDGTLIFAETNASRVTKIDEDGNTSGLILCWTILAKTNHEFVMIEAAKQEAETAKRPVDEWCDL